MSRYTREHRERTRQRIIETAAALFRRHGYDGVGIERIMVESGLTRGGFYHHFASKADLLAAMLDGPADFARRIAECGSDDPDEVRAAALKVVDGYLAPANRDPALLIEMLHDLQAARGWIEPAAITAIAGAINRSRAEVHGVVRFYGDFRTAPPPAHVLRICRGEACQACGCAGLVAAAQAAVDAGAAVAIEDVYCLGNCALGPAVQADGHVLGRVDATILHALFAAWRQ